MLAAARVKRWFPLSFACGQRGQASLLVRVPSRIITDTSLTNDGAFMGDDKMASEWPLFTYKKEVDSSEQPLYIIYENKIIFIQLIGSWKYRI